jgi:hypothetical protein
MEENLIPVYTVEAALKSIGLTDDVMAARIKILRQQALEKIADGIYTNPSGMAQLYDKLLRIIAYTYQIAGAHDCPEHILDVLADPEGATDAQIAAMLPYKF